MSKNVVRQSSFGKDLGLLSEVVVTGRKVGAGSKFYSALAHDEDLFRRVVEMVSKAPGAPVPAVSQVPGFAYDATAILGFGPASTEPLPEAAPGEIVIRYGGWSLQELRDSTVDKELMHQQDWYDEYPLSSNKLPAGIYRLRIPVPGSNRKTVAEQEQMLPSGETAAPVVLVATAMIIHRLQTKEDLLKDDWTRCKEQTVVDNRVGLAWRDGRLFVGHDWGDYRNDDLWLSSVRTS